MLALLLLSCPIASGCVEAAPIPDGVVRDETIREDDHFKLICHFVNEAAADQALAALKFTWTRAAELYGSDEDAELEVLTVHLYRDPAAYVAAEKELTQGAFERNLAFAHFDTLSAHVALQPPLSDEALAQVGLPAQTLRLLAHEAAHLVRFVRVPNHRSHPGWLADGAASWVDERVKYDLELMDEMEQDPNFSTSLLRVQRLLERDALPTGAEILRDQLDGLEFFERYDVRWLYFRFLMEGKYAKPFRKVRDKVRRLGGGANFTERLFEEILDIWSEKKLATIDKAFREHLVSYEPAWDEVFRALQCNGERWLQAGYKKNAIAWRREPAGRKYTLAGELTILPGPRQQMNVFVGRSDAGFFSVAFTAGGGITLFEYLSATSAWERRGLVECEGVRLGEPFAFAISVEKDRVSVDVGGRTVVRGEAQSIPLSGPWGLSAQANSAGTWKLERAPGL